MERQLWLSEVNKRLSSGIDVVRCSSCGFRGHPETCDCTWSTNCGLWSSTSGYRARLRSRKPDCMCSTKSGCYCEDTRNLESFKNIARLQCLDIQSPHSQGYHPFPHRSRFASLIISWIFLSWAYWICLVTSPMSFLRRCFLLRRFLHFTRSSAFSEARLHV